MLASSPLFLVAVCSHVLGGQDVAKDAASASQVAHTQQIFRLDKALRPGKETVASVAWSAKGNMVAAGTNDGWLHIWDSRDLSKVFSERAVYTENRGGEFIHPYQLEALAFHPDRDDLLMTVGGAMARSWTRGETWIPTASHDLGRSAWQIVFRPGTDDAAIVTMVTIRYHDSMSGQPVKGSPDGGHGRWTALAFPPAEGRIATGGQHASLSLWNGTVLDSEEVMLDGHTNWVSSVAYDRDGHRLASCSWDGTVRVYDPKTGKQLTAMGNGRSEYSAVAWSADSRWLLAGHWGGAVEVWDPAAETLADRLVVEGSSGPIMMAVAPGGGGLAVAMLGEAPMWIWRPTPPAPKDD